MRDNRKYPVELSRRSGLRRMVDSLFERSLAGSLRKDLLSGFLASDGVLKNNFCPMKKAVKTSAQIDKANKSLHRVHSSLVVDGPDRAASRAMLHPVGFTTEDFKKSQIGIASTWSMVTPCNMHIDKLAI